LQAAGDASEEHGFGQQAAKAMRTRVAVSVMRAAPRWLHGERQLVRSDASWPL
jgi:hypothetical protein